MKSFLFKTLLIIVVNLASASFFGGRYTYNNLTNSYTEDLINKCLNKTFPLQVAVVEAFDALLTAGNNVPIVKNIDDIQTIYKRFHSVVVKKTVKQFPNNENDMVFGCISTFQVQYCYRNCDSPAFINEDFCPSTRKGPYIANIIDLSLQTNPFSQKKWQLFDFDPYNITHPIGNQLQNNTRLGPQDGRDSFWWPQKPGWLTIQPDRPGRRAFAT
eukprot:Pgem_evm1s9139